MTDDQPQNEEDVLAKITNLEEFTKLCQQLTALEKTPETAKVTTKNEMKNKIETFMIKGIEKYCNEKKADEDNKDMENKEREKSQKARIIRLIEFLLVVDQELPYEEFFSEHGIELFVMFFKLTFYEKDIQYSVYNKPPR